MRARLRPTAPRLPLPALWLLVAACAGGEPSPPRLARVELAEILAIEDRRDSPALLAPFLEHADARVRDRAARAAGRLGTGEALPLLAAALTDDDDGVRLEATFALGILDESPAVQREAGRRLLHALADPEAGVRAAAVRALCRQAGALALAGEEPDEGWAAAALPLLEDPGREVRREALLGLWLFPQPVGLEAVVRLVGEEDPEIRWAAAYHLSRRLRSGQSVGATPVPRSLPLDETGRRLAGARLLAAGADPEEEVRREAARGLGHVPGEESLRALAELAADPSWRVRVEAMRGLAAHPDRRAEQILLALGDPSPHVRAAALAAAAVAGGEAPLPLRQKVVELLTDPGEEVRIAAHAAAASILPAETYASLTADPGLLLRGGAGAGEATAAAVLRGRAAALGLPALLGAGRGADGEEGAALLEAALGRGGLLGEPRLSPLAGAALQQILWEELAGILESDPAARSRILESLPALLPPDTAALPVREAALSGLAGLLGALTSEERRRIEGPLTAALGSFYRAGLADETMDVRRAAIEGLAVLEGGGSLVLLEAASESDPSPWLRRHAAALAGRRGSGDGPKPYPARRSLEDYRALLSRTAGVRRVRFETARGDFVAELFGHEAPVTVDSFLTLARRGYFDGQRFHRVVPDFVLQGGDPRGDGYGGPGFEIRCEINPVPYGRGTLGMALAGKDTGGSQFFVTHSPQPHLDGRYTVFGQVVSGQEVVDALSQGEELIRVVAE